MEKTNKSYDLLIVFANGSVRRIRKVSNYGYQEPEIFYFEKDETHSFVSSKNVLFFGDENVWEGGLGV